MWCSDQLMHASHLWQPIDQSVSKTVKKGPPVRAATATRGPNKGREKSLHASWRQVVETRLPNLYDSRNPKTIQNGWRASGLFPYSPALLNDRDQAPQEVVDVLNPIIAAFGDMGNVVRSAATASVLVTALSKGLSKADKQSLIENRQMGGVCLTRSEDLQAYIAEQDPRKRALWTLNAVERSLRLNRSAPAPMAVASAEPIDQDEQEDVESDSESGSEAATPPRRTAAPRRAGQASRRSASDLLARVGRATTKKPCPACGWHVRGGVCMNNDCVG